MIKIFYEPDYHGLLNMQYAVNGFITGNKLEFDFYEIETVSIRCEDGYDDVAIIVNYEKKKSYDLNILGIGFNLMEDDDDFVMDNGLTLEALANTLALYANANRLQNTKKKIREMKRKNR